MEYLRQIWLVLLIAGVVFSANIQAKPKKTDGYDDYGDYPGDDDYVYDDEVPASPSAGTVQAGNVRGTIPPSFEQPVLNRTVFVGEDIMLPCDANNLQDDNLIIWYNGTQVLSQHHIVLSQKSRVSVFKNFSLEIFNVNEFDTSAYYCDVLPQKIRQVINLRVTKTRVAITSHGEDVTNAEIKATEGDRIEFKCSMLSNDQSATMKWSRRGERVDDGSSGVRIHYGKIIIENVEHHHHGLYQCLADSGQQSPPHASVTLNVKFRPKISIKRHYVNAAPGDSAEMNCLYHANPGQVNVFWSKEGTSLSTKGNKYETRINDAMDIYEVNHTTLIINNVESSDYAAYECVIRNDLGEGSGVVHLIQEPEPARFENMTIKGRRASLHWLTRSKQLLSEAVLDYRFKGSDRWMTEMVKTPRKHETGFWKITHEVELAPGSWHVRIKTKNIGGWSKFSKDHSFEIIDKPEQPAPDAESIVVSKDQIFVGSIGGSHGENNSASHSIISTFMIILTIVPLLCRM